MSETLDQAEPAWRTVRRDLATVLDRPDLAALDGGTPLGRVGLDDLECFRIDLWVAARRGGFGLPDGLDARACTWWDLGYWLA